MLRNRILTAAALTLGALALFPHDAMAAPSPIASLQADQISGTSDGDAVTLWRDSGGHGYDAHGRAHLALHAINGLPAVRFNAAQDEGFSVKRPVQDDFTLVCVFQSAGAAGDGGAFYSGASLIQGEVAGVASDFGMSLTSRGCVNAGVGFPDTTIVSHPGFGAGKPHVAVFTRVKHTGALALYVDGVPQATAAAGTQSMVAPIQLSIGGGPALTGDIGEIAFYSSALSDTDRKEIEKALKQKWGIS